MTLADIRKQLPSEGKTCGTEIPSREDAENWMDHALEKLACQYINDGNLYAAGMATAMQVMSISMTVNGVNWEIIQDALKAMEYYMP